MLLHAQRDVGPLSGGKDIRDPLNFDHWDFYVIRSSALEEYCRTRRMVSLDKATDLGATRCQFAELKDTVDRISGRQS